MLCVPATTDTCSIIRYLRREEAAMVMPSFQNYLVANLIHTKYIDCPVKCVWNGFSIIIETESA